MHIPGRFCYLCNEKETKQKINRLPSFHLQCTLNVKLYYDSKIIIFFENLFPGLTGSGAENLFDSILPAGYTILFLSLPTFYII